MIIRRYFLLAVSITILCASCKKETKTITQTESTFKKEGELTIFKADSTQVKLDIEIADTEFDTQTGLMYRSSMEPNQAMLFVFDGMEPRSFYMKNTQIPLDIIFIDNKMKIVSFQKNAKPLDETSLPSNGDAQYVLEINAGLADNWKLNIGDSLSYKK